MQCSLSSTADSQHQDTPCTSYRTVVLWSDVVRSCGQQPIRLVKGWSVELSSLNNAQEEQSPETSKHTLENNCCQLSGNSKTQQKVFFILWHTEYYIVNCYAWWLYNTRHTLVPPIGQILLPSHHIMRKTTNLNLRSIEHIMTVMLE